MAQGGQWIGGERRRLVKHLGAHDAAWKQQQARSDQQIAHHCREIARPHSGEVGGGGVGEGGPVVIVRTHKGSKGLLHCIDLVPQHPQRKLPRPLRRKLGHELSLCD